MALYGVIGDIHGNKEALLATLAFFDERGIRHILCVGDIVGYNADSNACVTIVQERHVVAVAGNHDLISIRHLGVGRCSDKAAYALKRTRVALTPTSAHYLASLPHLRVIEDRAVLVHAGLDDVQLYMRTPSQVRDNATLLQTALPHAHLCFFGHTHDQRVFHVDKSVVSERPAQGQLYLPPGGVYFINPGSVDAARKADGKCAECLIFDSGADRIEFFRLPYDWQTAEAKARLGGYRMDARTAWLYALRRRLRNRLRRLPAYLPRLSFSRPPK
jgi:predicted phosphodiesterase